MTPSVQPSSVCALRKQPPSPGAAAAGRRSGALAAFSFVFLAILIAGPRSHAETEVAKPPLWLHVNGYSYHFNATDAKDELPGFGMTLPRRPRGEILRAWEVDMFQDSAREVSAYIGHSWKLPAQNVTLGVTGAVMYHRNFAEQNDLRILPVAFPFIEAGTSRVRVRLYYVAPVRSRTDHQVALQLLLPLPR